MAEKIQKPVGGQFWHFRKTSIEERSVYFVLGMGQAHYFYKKGKRVIWLAVDPTGAKETARDFIVNIP